MSKSTDASRMSGATGKPPETVRRILDSCVRYGFCTNTCPTYVLTRDENESPRGRIALIRAMMDSDAPPDRDTVRHLDSCLGCLSCMTTCAAKVDYHHLIDHARAHVEQHYRRPLLDRLLRWTLTRVLPHPARFRLALRVAPLGRLVRWLDPRIAAMLDLRPTHLTSPPNLGRRRRVFPAEGARKGRVVLLTGCVQRVIADHVNQAAIRLLQRHGNEVVVLPQVECCGALTLHMGHAGPGQASARSLALAIAEEHRRAPLDGVVITASGCGTTIKDYVQVLAGRDDPAAKLSDAAVLAARLACDITEYLKPSDLCPVTEAARDVAVVYHDACSLQHGQKVTAQPRRLLESAGFAVMNAPESQLCCGSAGTYNLLHPTTAETLGRRKAMHLDSTGAAVVAAGNLGCMTQIGRFSQAPVVHTVELLDWATGGPMPPALVAVGALRRLPKATEPAPLQPDAGRNAGSQQDTFW